jgi:hypothetical protein
LSAPVGKLDGSFAAVEELGSEKATKVQEDEAASLSCEVVLLLVLNVFQLWGDALD